MFNKESFRAYVVVTAGLLFVCFSPISNALLITNGFTFSVADNFTGPSFQGTHFHSSTGGDFGNPAGKAEVGGFFGSEEVRGLSEYDLAGITAGGPAFVSFNVFDTDGLFGQGGGAFDIDIFSYLGNNSEDVSDWEATTTAFIGSFNTSSFNIGDILSFDVSTALDAAINAADSSFGIRLQQNVRNIDGPAYTFDTFRLTTTDESTVPEPSLLALLFIGLLGLSVVRKRNGIQWNNS